MNNKSQPVELNLPRLTTEALLVTEKVGGRAGDARERGAGAVVDVDAVARADGEAVPIDNSARRALGDVHLVGGGGDAARARDELAVLRQRPGGEGDWQ